MDELLQAVRAFADKANIADGDEQVKYANALETGLNAIKQAQGLLEALRSGDESTVEIQLTQWEDVNRTLAAIGTMDRAIENADNGVELSEVLDVVAKVVRIGVMIATLA